MLQLLTRKLAVNVALTLKIALLFLCLLYEKVINNYVKLQEVIKGHSDNLIFTFYRIKTAQWVQLKKEIEELFSREDGSIYYSPGYHKNNQPVGPSGTANRFYKNCRTFFNKAGS